MKSLYPVRVPGQGKSRYPGDDCLLLGLLLRLGLLRLLRLLRFLSHSILSRFHGLNATSEACLAEGQPRNILDIKLSRFGGACRVLSRCSHHVIHSCYGFSAVFAQRRPRLAANAAPASCLTSRERRPARSSSIQNHSLDWRVAGQSPLSGAAASCPQDNGDCRRRMPGGGRLDFRRGEADTGLGRERC